MIHRKWKSTDSPLAIEVTTECFDTIRGYCMEVDGVETGGVMVGELLSDHDALITDATGPPADSVHEVRGFNRGVEGVEEWLDEAYEKRGFNYFGEWHYHPSASPMPGAEDRQAMAEIAEDEGYDCPTPVLVIVGGDSSSGFTASVGVAHRGSGFEAFEEHESQAVAL